jgi:hypothetical protein
MLDASVAPCLSRDVGPTDVRAVIYSGLAAVAGAVCLAIAIIVARAEAAGTTPLVCRNLELLCWFSLGLGVLGTLGGIIARRGLPQKALSTLVISFSIGVALLALYTHATGLPRFVGEPMLINVSGTGPTNGLSQ